MRAGRRSFASAVIFYALRTYYRKKRKGADRDAQGIMGRTYEAMFPLIGVACVYLVMVMIFTWLLGKLERRLRQSDRR